MVVVELLLFLAALGAVAFYALYQIVTQVKELRFYRRNGGDFSQDSGLDKTEEWMTAFRPLLGNWPRLYLFRPTVIVVLFLLMAAKIASLF